jgi:D-glycerate 3-kinase
MVELIGRWIARGRPDGRPALIGVAGSQASGKTTLCRAAVERFGAAHFSIDDVYLTRAERERLARAVHPLFAVRGPPGTHDLDLARHTIEALRSASPKAQTPIPSFDKLADARLPSEQWPVFHGRPSAVLVDGWLMGATPIPEAELEAPVNALEAEEDPRGVWRRRWDQLLGGEYADWFASFDAMLFLAAPSFTVVLDWRCEQEAGLMGLAPRDLPPERREKLARFIAHYQRLTEHMLAGGVRADVTVRLSTDRSVISISGLPA